VKRNWPIVLACALGIVILCGLGAWQLNRLAEKRELLEALDQKALAAPISLAEALAQAASEFTAVKAKGQFNHATELRKQATFDGGPGWQIITPFTSNDGISVLVDRGTIPDRFVSDSEFAASRADITGIIRFHGAGQGIFDPENDEQGNRWYWWDVPAMQAAAQFPANSKTAPFILQLVPQAGQAGYPVAAAPDTGIRNNHLQYAITWFALAAVLAVFAVLLARRT
jgi:surfeit locus 1 family protein